MRLYDKFQILFLSLIITHIICTLFIHNPYYQTLDYIFSLNTEKTHGHSHKEEE